MDRYSTAYVIRIENQGLGARSKGASDGPTHMLPYCFGRELEGLLQSHTQEIDGACGWSSS